MTRKICMRKLTVSIGKGGVGKTTTAVNLAHGLAQKGARVLLIDLDTQGQAAKALGITPEAGIAELIGEVLRPEEAVTQARERLWFLAGGKALAGVKRLIARMDIAPERVLATALKSLDGVYDFVILDTAPSWDVLNINALFYAEEVLAPVSLEGLAVSGLQDFMASLSDVQELRPEIELKYVLPTFYDRRVKQSDEILEQLRAHFNEILQFPIRVNVRLSEAPLHGQTIFEYAPRSSGAEDYQELAKRILNG